VTRFKEVKVGIETSRENKSPFSRVSLSRDVLRSEARRGNRRVVRWIE
jgi:hypothetical protein